MDLWWGFYLGWDWSPTVFFILLGLSVLLASKVKGWPVLWCLPALVLYLGLTWGMPDLLMTIFKWLFWIGVVVAVVTAFLPGKTRLPKGAFNLMAALIAWLLVLMFLAWTVDLMDGDNEPEGTVPPSISETCDEGYEDDGTGNCVVVEEPEVIEPPASCPARFVQDLDSNKRNRFVSDGFEGTPKQKRVQMVQALASDYRYLHFVGEQLFGSDIERSSLWTDDKSCLSEKGQRLHTRVAGALMASGVKNGQAPSDSFNTGMEDGKAVVSRTRGVYGDRSATIYRLADGTRLVVLDRCGNMTVPSKPKGVPEGPTDNPPPPKEDKPPKHDNPPPDDDRCVEIPNNGVYDCGSKNPATEPDQQDNVPDQVSGQNPGTTGPASPPSATPSNNYDPPDPPQSEPEEDHNPPPPEPSTPPEDEPEGPPDSDPCSQNPDFCD